MAPHDGRSTTADHAGGQHEFALLEAEHRAAGDAHVVRNHRDTHGDHQIGQAAAEDGDDRQRQQNSRKCQQQVHHAHADRVEPAAVIAGGQPQAHAEQQPDADRDQANRQRLLTAPDHAREDVATEAIGAHQVGQ